MQASNPHARSLEELQTHLEAFGISRTHEVGIGEGAGTAGYVFFKDANDIHRQVDFDLEVIAVRQVCALVVSLTGLPYGGVAHNENGHRLTIYRA